MRGRRSRFDLILLLLFSCAMLTVVLPSGCSRQPARMYAYIDTSLGRIICLLYEDESPNAVSVFTDFASGNTPYVVNGKHSAGPLYNGTVFYRTIPGKIIEAGDPAGDGATGPGVRFQATLTPGLTHDRPGILGMVPYGEGYYGSQFYITLAPMPERDGTHTIFGHVVVGLDVAEAISRATTEGDEADGKPIIQRVIIGRR